MIGRRIWIFKLRKLVKIIFILVSSLFMIVQTLSMLRLNEYPPPENLLSSPKLRSTNIVCPIDVKISKYGETILNMLSEDLPFTLFLPSDKAFERDLKLNLNDRLIGIMEDNKFAILTRVLGFSAVPKWIYAADLEDGKEMTLSSISGFDLFISKDSNGTIIVNGVASEKVDLKMGKKENTLVHVMNAVIMDSEFEESMQPDDEEDK